MSRRAFDLNETEIFLTVGSSSTDAYACIAATYNTGTEPSAILARLPNYGKRVAVSISKGEIMMLGGLLINKAQKHVASRSVDIFVCSKTLTRSVAPLNIRRWGHGASANEGTVVVCGGHDLRLPLKSCELYFCSESRWRLLPEMNENRLGVAVVFLPDKRVFAIGGVDEYNECLSSVEFYRLPLKDVSCWAEAGPKLFWHGTAPMRIARCEHAAILFQDHIFVAGGYSKAGVNLSSAEIFNVFSDTSLWILLSKDMTQKRMAFSLVASSSGLFAFGSSFGQSSQNTVERLENGNKYSEGPLLVDYCSNLFFRVKWESMPLAALMGYVWGAFTLSKKFIRISN